LLAGEYDVVSEEEEEEEEEGMNACW